MKNGTHVGGRPQDNIIEDFVAAIKKINRTKLKRDVRKRTKCPVVRFDNNVIAVGDALGLDDLRDLTYADLAMLEANSNDIINHKNVKEYVYTFMHKTIIIAGQLDRIKPDEKGRKELPWYYVPGEPQPYVNT